MSDQPMTPEQWAEAEEAGYVAAIIKGSRTLHAMKLGERVAVCGRKPGEKKPGSTHRNRTGWRGYFPKGSGHVINCANCAKKLLPKATSQEGGAA